MMLRWDLQFRRSGWIMCGIPWGEGGDQPYRSICLQRNSLPGGVMVRAVTILPMVFEYTPQIILCEFEST
jgi:hypothetical protein